VAQLLRRDDLGARRRENRDGDLEHETHREQRDGGEVVVLVRLHEHVELVAVEVLEEAHRRRQHDEVAEQHAGDEQQRDRHHERGGDLLLVGTERRQQEAV
jgi:hypothetical protein